ncbi:DUF885 family protein [Catalinimonas niigatensis]|uniref:DUF885 family protein n=1 Tax=Catalinimonas niigatensis TaxID=1397264 RepID=UPI002AA2AE4F|nr:DUF885 family protein [Catalinimonas niigatensis]WPP50834.1 DUF885 family protein [Catalinimonas niigatensis]
MRYFCLILIALLMSCNTFAQSQLNPLYQQSSEVNNLMVHYQADLNILSKFYSIKSSPERIQRLQQLMSDYQQQLAQLPFNDLPTGSRVDYLLFQKELAESQYQLKGQQQKLSDIQTWIPFASVVYDLNQGRRRGTSMEGQQVAGQLNELSKDLKGAMDKLSKGDSVDSKMADQSIEVLKEMKDALSDIYTFYHGYDPMFTWWTEHPYHQLDTLLTSYADSLHKKSKVISAQKRDASGIVGNPIGKEELIRQLENEMIPYTPEKLIEIANKEFAWCDEQMLKASQEMGFGNDWHAALEQVKNTYVPPGKQPELILRLYNESVDFLKEHDLISIPPLAEESWRMSMMTPERQLVNPFFLGGETIIISYPTHTMSHEDKLMSMRGNNPHFSRSTVHHELIAGHGLQYFMNNRYKTYRNFYTPFWMEGWALYWERLLWDLNFPQSAEDRIGMLFWRMHRCARIIFSLNYHLGEWTPQQCIDFLVERVGRP